MPKAFVNRNEEITLLNKEIKKSKLIVISGRRRVGKTTLITHWGHKHNIAYSQAIEGSENLQVEQIYEDIKEHIEIKIPPASWIELLELLSSIKKELIIVFDEFPYLVESNRSLPSLLQKWIDHKQPDNLKLILSGSSQTMMHSTFLDSSSPLFERASRLLNLKPMDYKSFREFLNVKSNNIETFMKYSITGGIPKYWEYIDIKKGIIEFVDNMFFSDFSFLENEPYRILKDEKVKGIHALSILEAIGRGATKPSEIAKKLGIPQTNIGRPLQVLQDASIITRELPFGESIRSTKKILYHISDYALRFWFNIYSPHRSRWHFYSEKKKEELIINHSSFVLESEFRKLYRGSSRYWEGGNLEFDCVRFANESLKKVIITEIKWGKLTKQSKSTIEKYLIEKFKNSKFSKRYPDADFEILSSEDIIQF